MQVDIRTPIGGMFAAIGAILIGYGAYTVGSPIYAASAGWNVNLWWGGVMAAFGLAMLYFGRRSS